MMMYTSWKIWNTT